MTPIRASEERYSHRIKFIYLAFGARASLEMELKYSVGALLAEFPAAAGDIVVFTDRPERYAGNEDFVDIIDISQDIAKMTLDWKYLFRAKPCVLLRALRMFGCACVFMDADSFVEPGFARAITAQMKRGDAVMNRYLRRNPFPELAGCALELPSGETYRYEQATALMYNSGMIAVQPRHTHVLEDAVALIDKLLARPLFAHDIEQFALNEAFRLHGFAIAENRTTFEHYCSRWRKRYMHTRLAKLPHLSQKRIVARRPVIPLSRARTRLFKRLSQTRALLSHAFIAVGAYAHADLSRRAPESAVRVE